MERDLCRIFLLLVTISVLMASCHKKPTNSSGEIDFSVCAISGSGNTFDIVTYNIEEYPRYGEETAQVVAEYVSLLNTDISIWQKPHVAHLYILLLSA